MHYFLRVCAVEAQSVGRGVTRRRKGCFERSSSRCGRAKERVQLNQLPRSASRPESPQVALEEQPMSFNREEG